MILDLTDEEKESDSPQFKVRLKHDEQILKGLIEKLGSA